MIAKTSDLAPYLAFHSKGVTLAITDAATSKANVSTGDALLQLLKSEAKINQAFGEVALMFTRIATAVTAGAAAIVTDTIDIADWDAAGAVYFSGALATYTGITITGFTGLVSNPAVGVPAAPVGAFVLPSVNDDATDYYQRQEALLYRRLDLICKDAAYELWKYRFPADDSPQPIREWRAEVERAVTAAKNGNAFVSL